jgi:HprK-related kinase A
VTASDTNRRRTIGDLSPGAFGELLAGSGIGVRIGPFDARIRARVPRLQAPLYSLYRDYPLLDDTEIFNFHVALAERRRFGAMGARQVHFSVDGRAPHEDMPAEQALAVLEWGINLVIALRAHRYLMLHAAIVERGGHAMVMPASPGHGKTTLCAALVHRGWRLLSDEFGLIPPERNQLQPIPRPMALKNESIEVIRAFAPEAEFGPVIPNTRKGTVSHVKPPAASLREAERAASVGHIVFPRWVEGAALTLREVSRSEGFMFLAVNAFNYEVLGERAFRALREMVGTARCYRLFYSDLDEAITALGKLSDERAS